MSISANTGIFTDSNATWYFSSLQRFNDAISKLDQKWHRLYPSSSPNMRSKVVLSLFLRANSKVWRQILGIVSGISSSVIVKPYSFPFSCMNRNGS